MTICNTGALAAVERGTALGVIGELHARGALEEAFPLETRPLLQGARLTAWELAQMGAPFRLVVDGAAASVLARGAVDVVLIGADRIAANGDTANKVGSLSLAIAARHAGVPLLVVAPESTVDLGTASGDAIPIEERGGRRGDRVPGRPDVAGRHARAQPGVRRDAREPDHRHRHGPAVDSPRPWRDARRWVSSGLIRRGVRRPAAASGSSGRTCASARPPVRPGS